MRPPRWGARALHQYEEARKETKKRAICCSSPSLSPLAGRLEEVQRLVRSGLVGVGARDKRGFRETPTALLCAAENGHLEVIRWLLWEGGLSVEETTIDGVTALALCY